MFSVMVLAASDVSPIEEAKVFRRDFTTLAFLETGSMRVGVWILLGCMIVTGHYYFCGSWSSSRMRECCGVHFETLYGGGTP